MRDCELLLSSYLLCVCSDDDLFLSQNQPLSLWSHPLTLNFSTGLLKLKSTINSLV